MRTVLSIFLLAMLTACRQPATEGTVAPNEESPMANKVEKTDAEWRAQLSPEAYDVLRKAGTERPGTGKLLHNKDDGTYMCGACGAPLFSSEEKYESGCGWPSFYKTSHTSNIIERVDNRMGMQRTEVICSHCGSHLGHLFNDGPQPTGMRYCINSVSLDFQKE